MCVYLCVCLCVYVYVCVCGGGGYIGLKSLCLNSYPYLIGFYSSFYRHALIQNFLGLILQPMYTYMPLSVKVKSDLHAGLHVDHVDIVLTCIQVRTIST